MIAASNSFLSPTNQAGFPVPAVGTGTGRVEQSGSSFLDAIGSALANVSSDQSSASTAETSFAAGISGASLGTALVTSDRAEIAWNATVAVRNEVVSAYQTIMNMPI